MSTVILITVLAGLGALLVRYARHDHFAGPAHLNRCLDELGPVEVREHLVPRR